VTGTRGLAVAVSALALAGWAAVRPASGAAVPADRTGFQAGAIARTERVDTVSGWVVDANDWLDRGELGVRHKEAAVVSADLGEPLVILTDSGSLVYPVTLTMPSGPLMDNIRLIPFAEQRIKAIGSIVTEGGEKGIVVDRILKAAAVGHARAFPAREVADTSVFGRITALSCWLGQLDTGADYMECSRAHAETGEPLVVVSDSGYMYYPVDRDTATDPPGFTRLAKYIEQDVVAFGTVIARGRERAMVIDSVAAHTPVETLQPGGGK
jgi:hypothetical protein